MDDNEYWFVAALEAVGLLVCFVVLAWMVW
jgi:hypothetical protein